MRELEQAVVNEEFEARVSSFLSSLLSEVNTRDVEAINTHLEEVRSALTNVIEDAVQLLFGGSIAKRTYVEGLSDVDSLVVLNRHAFEKDSPAKLAEAFAEILRKRFPHSSVNVGALAITIDFQDAQIQLLPALKERSGLRVPSREGSGWSDIVYPLRFAQSLTDANKSLAGRLIPAIKLAKLINSQQPEQHRLTGYHLEALALAAAVHMVPTNVTTKTVLEGIFTHSSGAVRTPIADVTGQSRFVDEYLGPAASIRRRIMSDSLLRIARRMSNADASQSIEQWRAILGEA